MGDFYYQAKVVETTWASRDFNGCYAACLLVLWSGILTPAQQQYYRDLADYCKGK